MKTYKNLIIVAGHAAFKDILESCPEDPSKDEYWVLQPFQVGEPQYYLEHIRRAVELLEADPSSLLLFSGGRTRREAGHWSEAASYRAVAEHFNYWSQRPQLLTRRIDVEEYARDSFQNLQYGLYRFYQLEGGYPQHVAMVGWKFKAKRFELHRKALNIPASSFIYVGVNNPEDLMGAERGEATALELFRQDPFGDHSPLVDKRRDRNPFSEVPPYESCPPIEF